MLKRKVHEAWRLLLENDKAITADSLKAVLTGKEEKPHMLIEVFRFMLMSNTDWASQQGKADKEAGKSANPPHSTFSSTIGSLADGDYVRRDGENDAYWDAYKSAQTQQEDDDDRI